MRDRPCERSTKARGFDTKNPDPANLLTVTLSFFGNHSFPSKVHLQYPNANPDPIKVYNKLLPANIMSYFKKINAYHNHNVRMKNCNFKIKFSRTNKKSECISVKGPKMWNDLPADIKLCKSMFTFKKMYKALLLQPYQFG